MTNTAQVTPDEDLYPSQGCKSPRLVVSKGIEMQVGCGQCSRCRRKHRQHWVGRCLLEMNHSWDCSFMTLTYAPDEEHADYDQVQKFAKRVRRRHPDWGFRYVARGEAGGQFGRWHYHLLAFNWLEVWPENTLTEIEEWPHGHVHFEPMTADTIGYVYSYTEKENSFGETRYSARPAIGNAGMLDIADTLSSYQQFAIAPLNFEVNGTKYPINYYMRRRIEERMVDNGLVPVPDLTAKQQLEIQLRQPIRPKAPTHWRDREMMDGETFARLAHLKQNFPYHPRHADLADLEDLESQYARAQRKAAIELSRNKGHS